MFRRLFGKGSNPNKGKKKRLSPTGVSGTAQGLALDSQSVSSGQATPGYRYALNEFAQTVAPTSGNDDGRSILRSYTGMDEDDGQDHANDDEASLPHRQPQQPQLRTRSPTDTAAAHPPGHSAAHPPPEPSVVTAPSLGHMSSLPSRMPSSLLNPDPAVPTANSHDEELQIGPSAYSPTKQKQNYTHNPPHAYRMRQGFPGTGTADATYEEWYGDGYLGGPKKYIYPNGYQSMRPRGGPWKLSIVVFFLFTWLSVFVIGHCSDRVDQSLYNQEEMDDDTLVIETRWCGSKLLYMMWVVSMLITGLATAYCSVIGYIKVRDFAVANTRSQAPGLTGKSDYYVELKDDASAHSHGPPGTSAYYHRTIYQSDGTPQFWGGHIYRPTQAAVAITSR